MRRAMIRSEIPRLVVRLSLKYIYVQIAKAYRAGDKILVTACSKELHKYGWKASCKNVPAAYLVGLLLGSRAKILGVEDAILDLGLKKPSSGARAFAVLKGVLDAGLKVPCDDQILPSEERIRGIHIASYAKKMFIEPQDHQILFSRYISRGFSPTQLTDHFHLIRKNVLKAYNGE
jgi:large subunit ribosomal protein L18